MRVVLIFLSTIPALAQFSSLVTTTDGSQLYFSSTLQLAGSADMTSNHKIFLYDGTTIRLYAAIAKVSSTPPPPLAGQAAIDSNYYDLRAPVLNGNGSETGYVGFADCAGPCTYDRILSAQTVFQFAGAFGSLTLPYACNLSVNGRYALCQKALSPGYPLPSVLVDLSTMQQSPQINTYCASSPHCVTSNGTVLISTMGPMALWSASGSQTLPISGFDLLPMISDDGSVVVHGTNTALASYNVATGIDTPLLPYAIENGVGYIPSLFGISNDARWILAGVYNRNDSKGVLTLIDSADGSVKQLPTNNGGVQTATLSGDGAIAYAVTTGGTLLKINTQSSVSQVIVASQPVITSIDGAPVPGSFNRLQGSGLAGAQITLNGAAIPILSTTATEIDVQIPWETQTAVTGDGSGTTNATLQIMPAAPTAFQQLWPLRIQAFAPMVDSQPIHQDFSGFISPLSPALGGEVVNFYFTGLGAVSPAATDGQAAGTAPLSLATAPLTLVSDPGQAAAKLVYAGLAPGTVGLYQVSIQLPAKINRTNPFLPGGPNYFSLRLNGIDLTVWALPN
jgi:uncharacterized protein (TIGR03437 family)